MTPEQQLEHDTFLKDLTVDHIEVIFDYIKQHNGQYDSVDLSYRFYELPPKVVYEIVDKLVEDGRVIWGGVGLFVKE